MERRTAAEAEVLTDEAGERLVIEQEGEEAELRFRLDGERLVITHTEVPDALGGRGIGSRLARAAVDRARTRGETIVPLCPFARSWLERHPEEIEGVEVDWARSG